MSKQSSPWDSRETSKVDLLHALELWFINWWNTLLWLILFSYFINNSSYSWKSLGVINCWTPTTVSHFILIFFKWHKTCSMAKSRLWVGTGMVPLTLLMHRLAIDSIKMCHIWHVTTPMAGDYRLWLNGNAIGDFNIYIKQVWKAKWNSYSIRVQE